MSRKKKTEETAEEVMTLETPETIDETPEETEETQEDTPVEDAQEESEPTEAEPVAYIGPNIKHVTRKGTVYKNGIPVKLEQKIEEIPAIRGLIVPVSKLAESCRLRDTEGTALYNLYLTVLEKL